jgi:hypothetical protein
MSAVTREQVADALTTMRAVVETVRDLGRVPSGTVYATLMSRMDLSAYNKMVSLIVGTGLVRLENHELVWVG